MEGVSFRSGPGISRGNGAYKLKGLCRFTRSCSGLRLVGMTLQGRSGQSWG